MILSNKAAPEHFQMLETSLKLQSNSKSETFYRLRLRLRLQPKLPISTVSDSGLDSGFTTLHISLY